MSVSVVILSYRPDDLRDLLACLRAQTTAPREVIVIDTSNDGCLEQLAQQAMSGTTIELVYSHRPDLGTARGRNLGIQMAQGDFTVLLDDDMLIAPDYLETALTHFAKPDWHDVAGITLRGPYPGASNAATQASWKTRLRHAAKCLFMLDSRTPGIILPTGFRSELPEGTAPTQWLQGGNSVWRTAILREYLFDPEMEHYPYVLSEDLALSARVGQTYRLFAVHGSGCHHKKSPGQRLDPFAFGDSLVRNHRHVARIRAGGKTPLVFYWGYAGLALQALGLLVVRPSSQSMGYLQGITRGLDDPSVETELGATGQQGAEVELQTPGQPL